MISFEKIINIFVNDFFLEKINNKGHIVFSIDPNN
jgi:hypothetical protein